MVRGCRVKVVGRGHQRQPLRPVLTLARKLRTCKLQIELLRALAVMRHWAVHAGLSSSARGAALDRGRAAIADSRKSARDARHWTTSRLSSVRYPTRSRHQLVSESKCPVGH